MENDRGGEENEMAPQVETDLKKDLPVGLVCPNSLLGTSRRPLASLVPKVHGIPGA